MATDIPLWKRIAGAVVELEDDAATPPQPTAPVKASAAPPAPGVATSAIDQALHDALMRSALSRKTTFSGLIESAERLRNVPGMDDTQRIKAAAAMAGSVTTEMITQAAASHVGDITIERSKFNREIAGAKVARVDTVSSQAANLDTQVQQALAEAQRLSTQAAALTEQAAALRANATAAEAEIAQTISVFEATAAQVEQYVTTTRDAIVSALK